MTRGIRDQSHTPSFSSASKTRDGVTWDAKDDQWVIPSPGRIEHFNFRKMRECATDTFVDLAKNVLMHYLCSHSVGHARAMYYQLGRFLRHAGGAIPVQAISADKILSYRGSLNADTEHNLGSLRGLLETWHRLGLPGLEPDVVPLLQKMRLRGNKKGEAILTADPVTGAFTDVEVSAITGALNDRFATGEISTSNYLLVWLFLALGCRPSQLALLKVSDFAVTRAPDGAMACHLKVPRVKQRGVSARVEFKTRKLIPELGELLETFIADEAERWRDLGLAASGLPIFVNIGERTGVPGFEYHCTSQDLAGRVDAVFAKLDLRSERTGERIAVTTRRFRYTRGTNAAREGASELVIAEILDHNDTQNVGVYVEAVPEIVERIDRALAMHLAPMAQAFTGQLLEDETQAARGNDPRSRIVAPDNLAAPVGSCGSFGFCGAMAPVACYTCRSFQPWLDGPHDDVLKNLLNERSLILEEIGDLRVAAVNDRTIYACAEVVRQCAARMHETGERQ